ncbi:Hypothetical protein CINCED_3A010123 [Cinara cedri]|uniref:Uncharacterized protein n=1 Tax=Cinara cedri TaxID=506608 RepID=A0A5E4NRH0_9HEMI|nr:Hypothetical protein CINCED_3A010123 [Cinara cedri]
MNSLETAPFDEKKIAVLSRPCHKSMKTMAKLHEFGFILLPHPPYSPDLTPQRLFPVLDLKRTLAGKKFSANEEVIAKTETYFEAKDKSYYNNDIKKLEIRCNCWRCMARLRADNWPSHLLEAEEQKTTRPPKTKMSR